MEQTYSMSELLTYNPETLWHVLIELRYSDLLRFCATSKSAQEICDDDYFWKLKTQRDFGVESSEFPNRELRSSEPIHSTWKEEYQFHLHEAGLSLIKFADYGLYEKVKELLDFGVNPNIQAEYGNTALYLASWNGNIDIVELLLKNGANLNIQDKNGDTALMNASSFGYTDVVQLLLENDADPNIQNKRGETALMMASNEGYTEIVTLLRKYKAKS